MSVTALIVIGIGLAVVAGLQLALLLRRPAFTPQQRDEFERLDLRQQNRAAELRQETAAALDRHFTLIHQQLEATRLDTASKLDQRLGSSFSLVSQRLEALQRGLGEINSLTAGVSDLRNLLTNVKARGTWAEIQLGALLEDLLAPSQFARNVHPLPNSPSVVEFAIRLPGQDDSGTPLWLPIDSKFPKEDYERLTAATQSGDTTAAEAALTALHRRLKDDAKTIASKYIHPPHTTDFAILFLPTEGLYAEALRAPGLLESIQHDHRILVAGPTTLAALLNALQMGFRTLALQQRAAEVWQLLAAVRTEFLQFAEAFARLQKKLQEANGAVEAIQVRTRAMDRRLRTVDIHENQEGVTEK